MGPSSFSRLSQTLDNTPASLRPSGSQNDHSAQVSAPQLSRKRDILLAFFIVSLPLLLIAILLLAFIFHYRENPTSFLEIPALPLEHLSPNAFYTSVDAGNFLLVGSWASNIATIVVAPFMVLFSYAVAREILQHTTGNHENTEARPPLLREIMRGAHLGMWHWVAQKTYKRPKGTLGREPVLRVVDVAGLGLFTATLLAVLVIVGDNWLHIATQAVGITHYEHPTNYTQNKNAYQYEGWANATIGGFTYQAGLTTDDRCDKQLAAPLPPQNISSAPLPCSLNETGNLTNVANPPYVYLTLGTGISQISTDFNGLNFTQLQDGEEKGTATPYEIVTYLLSTGVSHSLLFNLDAAEEDDLSAIGVGTHYGIDYVANTTSMVTECTFATQKCGIHFEPTNSSDGNNISIPFHCYPDFSGNLGQTPATGHERAQGWNMSFYQLTDGIPTNIPVQAQSNPFHFYVATAVNSIDLQTFETDTGKPSDGSFVDAGQGFIAFALNCEATIYDVTFSIVNGSFQEFNSSKSSPQKANIIQAPLQVGFGQYHLYQAASIAVLANNDSVNDTMGMAFSQTGMALASGVFDTDYNVQQRLRWTVSVTKVPKAPLFYLVIVCLVYSVLGMVMSVLALHLRRRPEVRDQQARLMNEWASGLLEMEDRTDKKEKGMKEWKNDRGLLQRSSNDLTDTYN